MGKGPEQKATSSFIQWVGRVVEIFEKSDATELEIKDLRSKTRLRLKRPQGVLHEQSIISTKVAEVDPYADKERFPRVLAPLAGLWWSRPAPTAPPYVGIGELVGPNTLVGLLESMKIFNEVRASDISKLHPEALNTQGVLVKTVAEEGQLVHAGDELMILDRAPKPDQPIPYGPPRI